MKKGEGAKNFLADVNPQQAFWVNNGPVISNLKDLAAFLKKISPEQFAHHVNASKNDFAKWVNEVVGDHVLSKKISALKTKDALVKAVSERVSKLQAGLLVAISKPK